MKRADFLAAEWPAPASIVAGTTLRTGGYSAGPYESLNLGAHVGDAPGAVRRNRERLKSSLALPAEPAWLCQMHGTRVVAAPFEGPEPEADACFSTRSHTVCVVMTADCLPVLFCSRDGRVVAAVHAGWRGLADGVLEQAAAALPVDPGQLLAWLGPAISQASFEVGTEVRARFAAADPGSTGCFEENERGRWQADLYGLARRRLARAGVTGVFGGGHCTYRDRGRFFSYRRDGQCGRMASLIFRRQ